MKIAQIAPLAERCPPLLYGGTERVVSYLTEELVELGHDVTLFASGDSITAAELVACSQRALRLDPDVKDPLPHMMVMLERVAQRAHEFDVLHFHIDLMHAPIVREYAERTLTTLHGRLDLPDLKPFYSAFPRLPVVSISDAQRRPLPHLNWAGTVHHGLPPQLLSFNPFGADGYLAFLGRISPEKRPDRAIEIAEHQKAAFLGGARALLFPIDWCEPFGLVMIEAMACGTPVIAYANGSVPEVIDEGLTGSIVGSIDEAVSAVRRLDSLDRARVRSTFEARFTSERMARDYVEIYRSLSEGVEPAWRAEQRPRLSLGA